MNGLSAAFDLGAGSGRAFVGGISGERVTLEEVHRFTYAPRRVDGHLRWDMTLIDGLGTGRLAAAAAAAQGTRIERQSYRWNDGAAGSSSDNGWTGCTSTPPIPPSFIGRSSRSSSGFVTADPNHHQRILIRLSSGGDRNSRASSATGIAPAGAGTAWGTAPVAASLAGLAVLATSTAYTCVGPCMFERNTIHLPSGVKVTFGSSR